MPNKELHDDLCKSHYQVGFCAGLLIGLIIGFSIIAVPLYFFGAFKNL